MKLVRTILLVLIGIALIFKGYTAIKHRQAANYKKSMQSIVRLHLLGPGSFFCTGTVISENTILTAAHCVAGARLGIPLIEVRGNDGARTGIAASVINYSERPDYALLKGNFIDFPAKDIVTDPDEIESIIKDPNSDLVMCGFPYAGPLVCTPFKFKYKLGFQFAGSGYLYPGMSGGPVIDRKSGKVVAENLGVEGVQGQVSNAIISPLINIYYGLGIITLDEVQ